MNNDRVVLRHMIRIMAVASLAFAATAAQARSAIFYKSSNGDYIGQGQTLLGEAPTYTFSATQLLGGKFVRVRIDGAGHNLGLDLNSNTPTLTAGAYESAARASFSGTSPGVDFGGDGRGCNQILGRFTVLEIELAPDGTVPRLAANFEQRCEGTMPPLYGEIRINSSIPLSHEMPAGDSAPDAFALFTQNPVQAGSVVTSNEFTIYGVNAAVPVSITGGNAEYSINGGAFTSAASTAKLYDRIQVRMMASFTGGATKTATLTAGGVSANYTLTTYQAGVPLTGIYYSSPTNNATTPPTVEYIGAGKTRLHLVPLNRITAARNFDNGVTFTLDGVLGTHFTLDFAAPGDALIVPGTYANATRFPFQAASAPGLSFSGDGRGCNELTGSFTVTEAVYNADNSIASFAASFQQKCDANPLVLTGEVRYNSTSPFTVLTGVSCTNADTDADGIPDCIEVTQGTNPELKDNDIFANPRLFVMQMYRDFLGREGDTGGIDYWSNVLASGQMTRAQVAAQFATTPEFEIAAGVARLYFAFFLRYPDYAGLAFWIDYRRQGNTLARIGDRFVATDEFRQRYGSIGNAEFVKLVYRNVLGRDPDAEGYNAWLSQLNENRLTWGGLMAQFSESAEYRGLITPEVLVTFIYARMLGRTPDPAGFAHWVQMIDARVDFVTIIGEFIKAPEYRARFLP